MTEARDEDKPTLDSIHAWEKPVDEDKIGKVVDLKHFFVAIAREARAQARHVPSVQDYGLYGFQHAV
jgi:hypothetical protein